MKEYITRTQFNSIKNHLIVKTGKPMMYDLFDVLNAVFHILITGSQWRNLPDSYPNWESVYYHYSKWKKNKVIHLVLYSLINKRKLDDPRLLIIDNQSISDSDLPSKKYKGYDGHKKRKGLKRCILVDNKGLIHDVKYFPANTSDVTTARCIIEHYKESLFGKNNKNKLTIIGDKGFNSPKVKKWAKETYNIDYKYIPRMKKPDLDTKTGWDL
ncbi:transposase [Candidatus Gracilibacteria bacterium]|nr:transposase [Candidatus Gracilibacteria bacterium]